MTVHTQRNLAVQDVQAPHGECRLELLSIAVHLHVTLTDLAAGVGMSRTSMSRLASSNVWPAGRDRAELQQRIREHLQAAGATAEMLAIAFHRFTGRYVWTRNNLDKRDAYLARRTQPAYEDDEMLLPKQTLNPEAKRHFRTLVNPFDGEVRNDAQMFLGSEVSYVFESMRQCAVTSSFVAVIGESGSGKSTIKDHFEARIQADGHGVILIKPHTLGMEESYTKGSPMRSTDIVQSIITTLDPTATVPQTIEARTTKARRLLTASVETGNSHLLVIEEGHALPDATLKHLKRLNELKAGRRPLLGVLIVAQPELKQRLDAGLRGGHLREVAQRCEVVQILPLETELQGYLEHRAKAIGRTLAEFVEPSAVDAIRARLTRHARAPGGGKAEVVSLTYPLAVNNFVTKAMNEAAALGVPVVTAEVVKAI